MVGLKKRISAYAGSQFTLTEFKEEFQTRGVHLTLADPEHLEINGKVKFIWRTLRTIAHLLMVNARVLEAYIHFASMYTTDHILPVLAIKDLINEDGNPTTPFKLATGTKPSASNLRVLFFSCIVQKYTAHVDKKALNIRHQAQEGFQGTFFGVIQHQKGYLVYVPSTRNIMSSYDVFFDDFFQCLSIYVTTIFRRYGYAFGCDIYNLCCILKGTNWRYNNVHTV